MMGRALRSRRGRKAIFRTEVSSLGGHKRGDRVPLGASRKGWHGQAPACRGAAMSFDRAIPVTTAGQVPLNTGCTRVPLGPLDGG